MELSDDNLFHLSSNDANNDLGRVDINNSLGDQLGERVFIRLDSRDSMDSMRQHVYNGELLSSSCPRSIECLAESESDMALLCSETRFSSSERFSRYKRKIYLQSKLRKQFISIPNINRRERNIITKFFKQFIIERDGKFESGNKTTLTRKETLSIFEIAGTIDRFGRETFLQKYKNNWACVRYLLTGQSTASSGLTHDLLEYLLNSFDALDRAFPFAIRERFKKKAFPHYDSVINRLLMMKGKNECEEELEELHTMRAKKKFELYWWSFCKFLKWPYISKDAKILSQRLKKRYGL